MIPKKEVQNHPVIANDNSIVLIIKEYLKQDQNPMTCCVCDYEWCWDCGKQYDPSHVCDKKWDPTVPNVSPKKERFYDKVKDSLKRGLSVILMTLVAFFIILPLVFICETLFWPSRSIKGYKGHKHKRGRCWREFCRVFISGIIGSILLPIGIYKFFKIMPQEIRSLKKWITRPLRPTSPPPKQDKRWLSGKASEFKYTEASRPRDEDLAEPNVNINVEAPYLNDSLELYRNRGLPRRY